MFSAPTTTSPALPAMPERKDLARLSLSEAAFCELEADKEFDPLEVEYETFWVKLLASSANAPGAAAIKTPMNIPATTRVQAWVRFLRCIGL
ncbi:conserved hypothetical protein [Paraburkholderia ribeironis]|uniref:Uncharacterized protein n=1 Tax=Paraburkholderia ribeironis TaxID=1247936 RepID=A0A1N7RRI8_9BURK|nr:conserved hypothetical protein [Paraburkholderia ribeironis]